MDASEVSRAPQGWRASGAFNFPELWWTTQRYRATDLPITPAIFMAICFEETACCNLQQGDTPVAVGPGQLQVSDDDKVMFFAGAQDRENFMGGRWDSSQTTWAADTNNKVFKRQKPTFPDLQPLTMDFILSNNPFSVQMHLKYFQWLMNGYGRSGKPVSGLGGLLLAQTGGGKNAKAGALFVQGGDDRNRHEERTALLQEKRSIPEGDRRLHREASRRICSCHHLCACRVQGQGRKRGCHRGRAARPFRVVLEVLSSGSVSGRP
jgi:hypothetical protein